MLRLTSEAAAVLMVTTVLEGAPPNSGVRIERVYLPGVRDITIAFRVAEGPQPDDEAFEQDGLLVFVDSALVELLDGRTLDLHETNEGAELVFR
jgi:Fe-S cluster assembly iron-binding protein IscA